MYGNPKIKLSTESLYYFTIFKKKVLKILIIPEKSKVYLDPLLSRASIISLSQISKGNFSSPSTFFLLCSFSSSFFRFVNNWLNSFHIVIQNLLTVFVRVGPSPCFWSLCRKRNKYERVWQPTVYLKELNIHIILSVPHLMTMNKIIFSENISYIRLTPNCHQEIRHHVRENFQQVLVK